MKKYVVSHYENDEVLKNYIVFGLDEHKAGLEFLYLVFNSGSFTKAITKEIDKTKSFNDIKNFVWHHYCDKIEIIEV